MSSAFSLETSSAWRSGRIVLWAGGLLLALVAGAICWIGYVDYREVFRNQRASVDLFARVLEEHATRTVDTAAIALSALAERLAAQPSMDPTELRSVLQQTSVALPFVRAVALVDRRGTVLSSTAPEDIGSAIDLRRLGLWPAPGRDLLGIHVAGRGLADLADGPVGSVTPAGVGFIPLLRALKTRSGDDLLVVGIINPEVFANYQALTLADRRSAAVLTNYGGDVLAATASTPVAPGGSIAAHAVFREYMATSEHVSYLGEGLRSEPQVVAFRVSRSRPLIVLVEHPQSAVWKEWWEEIEGYFAISAATLLILPAMTVLAWRGQRARETTRLLLDRAQAGVARRERELSATITSIQNLIFRTEATGTITFANARWQLIEGASAEAAVGKRLEDFVLPEQRLRIEALFADDAGIGARTEQATMRAADTGALRHFEVAVTPLLHQERIVGYAGSAVDVTERVLAQKKLQTQYAVTALMLEVSPLPLVLRDLSGHYLSVNRAWEEFTGNRRENMVGVDATPHLGEAEAALYGAQGRELLSGGGRVQFEATMAHADGSWRDVILHAVLVPGDDGVPTAILTVVMDVSEFRAAERATREARDAAEDASRAKSEFIANISHELRTPLQSILGFSELGAARSGAQAKLAAMFQEIHSSGERMLALVNDLLDVARIESSAGTWHFESADLRPLVNEVAREFEASILRRQLRLDIRFPEFPLRARVDPMRFQQVVRKVLANAVKFSPAQGIIELHGEAAAGDEVHLVVRDQGPGIPPAEVHQVFDAFIQSSKTKDGSGGKGLGLTVCRKILQAHGGRIHVENLSAGGAALHIHLPAQGVAETAPAPL